MTERSQQGALAADVLSFQTELGREIQFQWIDGSLHIEIDGANLQWYVLDRDQALRVERFIADGVRAHG